MYNERRRDPPVPRALCIRCGWSGTPHHAYLRDGYGDASLIVTQKPCPRCALPVTQLDPSPPVPVQLIRAVREAKLQPDQLLAIADTVRDAPEGLSPRALAEHVPAASRLITVASRIGEKWAELLVVAVTLVALYLQSSDADRAHRDAQQSHRDAAQAHKDAELPHDDAVRAVQHAGQLSDEDIQKLGEQVEAELKKRHKQPRRSTP